MEYNEIRILEKNYQNISNIKLSRHLNLDEDLIDTEHLDSLISASVDWVETRINGFVVPTKVEFNIYDFTGSKIIIEHKGVDSIESFSINGQPFEDYKIIRKHSSTHIILNNPVLEKSGISIVYNAGNTPSNNLIQAVLISASDMYDVDRSNYSTGLTNNRTVMRLLNLE